MHAAAFNSKGRERAPDACIPVNDFAGKVQLGRADYSGSPAAH